MSRNQVGTMMAVAVMGITSLTYTNIARADQTLKDTTNVLTDPAAWVSGISPLATDKVVIDNNLTGAVNTTYTWAVGNVSTNSTWLGIQVLNPGGNVTFSDTVNPITLGANGIDMSAATKNLTLNVPIGIGSNQTWSTATGRTLLVGGTVTLGTAIVSLTGSGNTTFTGSILGTNGTLNMFSSGLLTLSSQSTYTGATILGNSNITGGSAIFDFSGASAPSTNLLSSSSRLSLGGINLTVKGNTGHAVSQTFTSTAVSSGLNTLTATGSNLGTTVALGTLSWAFNTGASVRVIPNGTSGTFSATNAAAGTNSGLVENAASNAAAGNGAYMTYGLSDFAGVASGVIGATTYVSATVGGTLAANILNVGLDYNAVGESFVNNAFIDAIRFSGAGSKTITLTGSNIQTGGVLVAPNVGANDVLITATGLFNFRTETSSDLVIWQNNTQGNLIIAAPLQQRGGNGAMQKNGAGLLVLAATVNGLNGNLFINEGMVQNGIAWGSGGAGVVFNGATTTTLQLTGSVNNGTRTLAARGGGGVLDLQANNFTQGGVISGIGLFTKAGTGTMVISGSANTITGGMVFAGNSELNITANSTSSASTPLGVGPVTIGSGGTLTNNGFIPNTLNLGPGITIGGSGTFSSSISLPSGAKLEPGTRTGIGQENFQSLTFASGDALNMTLQGVPKSSDIINILSGGSLTLNSGLTVNMYYSSQFQSGQDFFTNGSYQLFSGVDVITAGKYAGGSSTQGTLTNFAAGNLGAGATASFFIIGPATASSIWVTISGAKNITTWQTGGTSSGTDWRDPGSWDFVVPGIATDTANFVGRTANTTVALNGNQHVGVLGLDSGTNSGGMTISAGAGGKLFIDNLTNGASIAVSHGQHSITSNVDLLSPTSISFAQTDGTLTITGIVNSPSAASSVTLTGSNAVSTSSGTAALILTATNTISAPGSISANGTLQFGNGGAAGSWGSGTITNSGNLIVNRTGTVSLTSLSGGLTGGGTLTNKSGLLVIDSVVTSGGFTGTLNVAAGTISIGSGAVVSAPNLNVAAGAVFDLFGNHYTANTISNTGVITNTDVNPAFLDINNGAGATLGGTITNSGSAPLSLRHTNQALNLTGVGTYTGEFINNGGNLNVFSNTALPAGTLVDVTGGLLNPGSEVNVAADVIIARESGATGFGGNAWDITNGNASFSGNWYTGTGVQFRLRVTGSGTATVTGSWSATAGVQANLVGVGGLFQRGNIIFTGTAANYFTTTVPGNIGQQFFIGRSDSGANSANLTFANGAHFINTSTPDSMINSNGGQTLGGAPTSGIQIGASGGTNAPNSLTVDHAYIDVGLLNVELDGQSSTSALNLIGGTITSGSFTKNNNAAATLFTINGGVLLATKSTSAYIGDPTMVASVSNLTVAIGVNGATINTTGAFFDLPIAARVSNGTAGLSGELVVIGTGQIDLAATTSDFNGATRLATSGLKAKAANAFSPYSVLKVYNSGYVDANNFAQTIGGLDDTAGSTGTISNVNGLTFNVASNATYVFTGALDAGFGGLSKSGGGTQILTATGGAVTWAGPSSISGGALILGTSTTSGYSIAAGALTFGGVGEGSIVSWKGTGGSISKTFTSLGSRIAGGTGNFVMADGVDATNFFKINTGATGFVDQGTFFNGANYAFIDTGSRHVRAENYGVDAGSSAANALTGSTNALLNTSSTQSGALTLNTLKVTGSAFLSQAGFTLNLTNNGILADSGSATISGGSILPVDQKEVVIRVNNATDNLTINSVILAGTTSTFGASALLTKSGAGTLNLGGANTYVGKLNVLNGTVLLSNASALQNMMVNLVNTQNPIQFNTGLTTAVLGGLISPNGSAGTLQLQTVGGGTAVNLIVKISSDPLYTTLSSDTFSQINSFNGVLTGTGSVTMVADSQTTGRYDFAAANTYSGGLTILSGRVQSNVATAALLTNGTNSNVSQAFGTGTVTLTGGTLGTSGGNVATAFYNDFNFNGNGVLSTGALFDNSSTNGQSSANATFNGRMFGSGTVTRTGGSTLVFNSTDNSNFKGTFINTNYTNGNNITFTNIGATPNTASSWIFTNNTTILVNTTASGQMGFGSLQGTVSGVTFTVANANTAVTSSTLTNATTLRIGDAGGAATFVGFIGTPTTGGVTESLNTMTLLKQGSGTQTLGGANNFSVVTVAGGTLGALTLDGGVIVNSNGGATAAGSTTLIVASNTGIATGMSVVSTVSGLTLGTTITNINGTTLTLSTPLSAAIASGAALVFEKQNSLGISGSITLGANTSLQYSGSNNQTTIKRLILSTGTSIDGSGSGGATFSNPGVTWDALGVRTLTLTGTSGATVLNTFGSQIVQNGTSNVSVVKSGTGVWALSNNSNTYVGGTTVNGGRLLITNSTGSALGTGNVTVSAGGFGGTGYTTNVISIANGAHFSPGQNLSSGTFNLGGTLSLAGGSIWDMEFDGPGTAPHDIVNLFGNGTITISSPIVVNLLNPVLGNNYFYNGTYNVATGLNSLTSAALNTAIPFLVVSNEAGSGGSFVFSMPSTTSMLLTISNAWNDSSWTNGNSDNSWTTVNSDWIGGAPSGSGNIATFGNAIAGGSPATVAQTITLGANKILNKLAFNSTYSYTLTANTIFMQNGSANIATITSSGGPHTVASALELDSPQTNVTAANNSLLVLQGNMTGAGSLSLLGGSGNGGTLAISGVATYGGGTGIASGAKLQIGNGGSTGSLSGLIDNSGTLQFARGDAFSFDPANLVQNNTNGTLAQNGTGALTLSTSTLGAFVPGAIAVNGGTLKFGTDLITNATFGGTGNTTVAINGGILDLNGKTEYILGLTGNAGTLTNSSATPGALHLSQNSNTTYGGAMTNSGATTMLLLKDGTGNLTLNGTIGYAGTMTITAGQVTYSNSNGTAGAMNGGPIYISSTTSGTTALAIGNSAVVNNPVVLTAALGLNDFVTGTAGANATLGGNVSIKPGDESFLQIRLGNGNTGVLTYSGTVTVPAAVFAMVDRGSAATDGNGLIDYPNSANPFQIGNGGTAATAVTFTSAGNSTFQSGASTNTTGLMLGATANTVANVHTITGGAIVRVGATGTANYDLQPSSSNTSTNTLNINGGSLILGKFITSGAIETPGSPLLTPQANVLFNGGAVVAGLSNQDIFPAGVPNQKVTIGNGGAVLDLNGKTNVQWSKQLTSTASGTNMNDGGLTYVSGNGPATFVPSTWQLYKGATTIGHNAIIQTSNNNLLGDPSVGAPLNFAGGTLAMTGSFTLGLNDGGSTHLAHRLSFNDLSDTGFASSTFTLNPNATLSGGSLHMSGMSNNSQNSNLSLGAGEINGGNYTNSGLTVMAWFTPIGPPVANFSFANIFSIGLPGGSPARYLGVGFNIGGNTRAMISALGTVPGSGVFTNEVQVNTGNASFGVEHMMTMTVDNSNISLYIDGVLRGTTPLTTANGVPSLSNIWSSDGIQIGGSVNCFDPSLNGDINEFRVYDTVLSDNYILASLNASANAIAAAVPVYRDINVATSSGSTSAINLGGSLVLNVGGNMAGAGTLFLTNGGSLVLTGNSSVGLDIAATTQLLVGTGGNLGALTGGNVNNAGKIFINRTDSAGIWGANIAGAGTITHVGIGTTTITGTNTYTGPLLLNAGKLIVGNNGTTGTLGSGAVTMGSNTVLSFNRSDTFTVNANISGSGSVTQTGSGRTQVGGTNSYSLGTTLVAGELQMMSPGAIGTVGTINFLGGTLGYSAANTLNYIPRFSTAAAQQYNFDTNGQTVTFTQALSSSGASSLGKSGAGTLVLTTANTYDATNISLGVLQVNTGAGIGTGTVTFGGPGILALNRTGSNTVVNTIAGSGGTLSQLQGTTILTGANTWSGGVNIAAASTLQVGNGATGSVGSASVANAGVLTFNRTGLLTVSGTVSGAGTVNHIGTGTTTLTSYLGTGALNVSNGTLALDTTNGARKTSAVLVQAPTVSVTNGSGTSALDLTNHDLLIPNNTPTSSATIKNLVNNGMANLLGLAGNPAGPQITSSTAANYVGSYPTLLYAFDFDSTFGGGVTGDGSGVGFSDPGYTDNVTITQPGTVIVKYNYYGDINFDGKVDAFDIVLAQGDLGLATPGVADIGTSYLFGDVDGDGHVTPIDIVLIQGQLGAGSGGAFGNPLVGSGGVVSGGVSAVPEPASLCLLGLGSAGMLLRRKRRKM